MKSMQCTFGFIVLVAVVSTGCINTQGGGAGRGVTVVDGVPVPAGWTVEKRRVETVTEEGTVVEKEITYYVNGLGMEFVWCPPGEFDMGSRETAEEVARKSDRPVEYFEPQHPRHPVTITTGFFLGAAEVTAAQFQAIGASESPATGQPDHPVVDVTWDRAVTFCRALSKLDGFTYGLPTEAQWEYACRAGTTTPFNCGDTISTDLANYDGTTAYDGVEPGVYRMRTTPAKSFPANAWGLYDMPGNVWEWCADWYGEDYYEDAPGEDPSGPRSGRYCVLRGGCWKDSPVSCRSAHRSGYFPDRSHYAGGFRVACFPR